jgi:hypothetical protein
VIVRETERLEQVLYGMDSEVTGAKGQVSDPGH